jgi:putative redox protein
MTHSVEGHIGRDHYRVEIRAGKHILIADEPESNGGKDLGPSPHQLLAAALTACTNATVRMYADRKQWPLEAIDTRVEIAHGENFDTAMIRREIRFAGPLSDEQRTRLLQIAERCPIHRTLTGKLHIATELAS